MQPANPTESADGHGEPDRLFAGRLASQLVALLGLIGLAAFSTTSVPVLLPSISGELGRLQLTPWVVTAFLLTSTIVMIFAGGVFDAIGPRVAFRWSSAVFIAASAVCGFAPTAEVLVGARAVQGAAAGFALTIGLAGIGVVVPAPLRGRAFAVNGTVWGVLAVGAPLVASVLEPLLGWRGVFHANAAVGVVIAVVGWRRLPAAEEPSPIRIDVVGFVLLTSLTVAVTLGIATGGLVAAVALVLVGCILVGYWVHSGLHPQPVFGRTVVAGRPFGSIHLVAMIAFSSVSGLNSYLPFYVETTLGRSTTASAVAIGALSIGWTIAMIIVARLFDRFSEASLAAAAYVIVLPSMALVTLEFTLTTGMVLLVVSMLLLGLGVGAVSSSMLVMLQASTTQETMGQATAVHQFSRNIGYTMAAALVGALVVNAIESSVDPATAERVLAGDDTSADASLGAAVATGFQWTGIVMFCFVTVGAVIAWRLHRTTAADGRHRRAP